MSYMLETAYFRTRKDRIAFNALASYAGVLDWLEEEGCMAQEGKDAAGRGIVKKW